MAAKLIIDVDTGVDDAQALMLALSRPDIEVLAITCVAGNCDIDQVCLNTLKVLTVCNKLEVPVYKGSGTALLGLHLEATHYHGIDGLGDADLDIAVSMDQIQDEYAVTALLTLVYKYPGEITLVTLAPLTNIALALRQDPGFGRKLKNVAIMGGNIEGKGNTALCGEFNFASDPDAAYAVLNGLGTPITVVPWDSNLSSATGYPWDWFDSWLETDSEKGRFNKAIIQIAARKERDSGKFHLFRSCDLNAMVAVVDPGVVMDTVNVFATVELNGKYTRGMLVVDWRGVLGKPPNMVVVKKIDTEQARVLFDKMVL